MFEPTGSVYLDRPLNRVSQPTKTRSPRVAVATMFGVVGVASMLFAAILTAVHFLVADSAPTVAAVDAALVSPAARAELHREISATIVDHMIGPEVVSAAATYGINVADEADLVVDKIIDDPAFRTSFDAFVVRTHNLILVDSSGPKADISAVTDAALTVIGRESPRLAVLIAPGTDILAFDSSALPDLTAPMRLADHLLLFALVGILAIPMASAIHPHRHRVLAWVGRAWLIAGGGGAFATVTLPYLAGRVTGWSTVEIAVRAGVIRFLIPFAAIALAGLAGMSAAAIWRHRELTVTSREGATAALGMGLIPGPAPSHGLIDLASRGLVDAGRTLTNI